MFPFVSAKRIAAIGAQVVGVCSALYLQRAGCRVTALERDVFALHHQAPFAERQRLAERFPAAGRVEG